MARATMNRMKQRRVTSGSRVVTERHLKAALRSHDLATRERKVFSATTSGTCSVAGVVGNLSGSIVQGDDVEQRNGQQILLNHCWFSFQATMNSLATSDRVRFLVFYDTQNQNSVPSVADIFDSASVVSPYNVTNKLANRFKVYIDHTFQLNTSGNAGKHQVFTVKTGELPLYFAGSTGNGRNGLFFLIISDTPTNLATYALGVQLRFFDS